MRLELRSMEDMAPAYYILRMVTWSNALGSRVSIDVYSAYCGNSEQAWKVSGP